MTQRWEEFRRLHREGCFVIPNPWDVGSARVLVQLGFRALATTSSGFAWSLGRADNHVRLEDALAHFYAIASAVEVPVNADFEGGFAVEPVHVVANVKRATETGIAGLSIEDSSGDAADPLFPFSLSVERIQAAREAIDESGTEVVLTGRSEGFIAGRPDLDETLRRLKAYADAGADCLYAPGIKSAAEIRAVVEAVAPKPVNVLAYAGLRDGGRARGAGREANQRRRGARAHRVDGLSRGGDGDRREGHIHGPGPRRLRLRAEPEVLLTCHPER